MKKQLIIIVGIIGLLFASCGDKEVDFTYMPKEPRAGQTIVFTNTTSEGEEWSWNFGDGTTSSSKNPSKIFKKPGQYVVVLKVDDKNSRTCTQTINVHDTVPAIGVSDSIVGYYKRITLSADIYNPYGQTLSYRWELPSDVRLLSGDLESRNIDVCFTRANADIKVSCRLTQGTTEWALDTTLHIEDTPAPALLYATDKQLFRQRIYEFGLEQPTALSVAAKHTTAPSALAVNGDKLYIFNADRTTAGTLSAYDLASGSTTTLLTNASAGEKQGFEHGFASGNKLYWTTADGIYSCAASASSTFDADAATYKLLSATDLGLAAGQTAGGLAAYNGMMLYAYADGISLFAQDTKTKSGNILAGNSINCFTIDPIAQKIYFTTTGGLYVSTISGDNVVLIDAEADGKAVCVAQDDNLLFWTTAAGIKRLPLIQSNNNTFQTAPEVVNTAVASALAADNTKR